MELDRDLIRAVRRFINGANVHYVNTWIYCYEMSLPDSPRRERYEALLRTQDFAVAKSSRIRESVTARKEPDSWFYMTCQRHLKCTAGDDRTVKDPEDQKARQMKTSEDVLELALYSNDCCNEELIFEAGDTFCRCPKCQRLCDWSLESKITDLVAAESDLTYTSAA